jgi:hypothetical protein
MAQVIKYADTIRKIKKPTNVRIAIDTERKIKNKVTTKNDTRRVVAGSFDEGDIKRISISLNTSGFAQRPTIETNNEKYLNITNIIGHINGYEYQIINPEKQISINKNSTTYTISGREDVTDVLYRKVNVKVANLKVSTILSTLKINYNVSEFTYTAGAIGAVLQTDGSFIITANYLKQLLDKMFGWSSGYYLREIYCVLRNGQIYVTEKDKYNKTYDIDSFVKSKQVEQITISEKLIRNFMEDEDIDGTTSGGVIISSKKLTREDIYNDEPFSGTIEFGESSMTYSKGLIMSEKNNKASTTYSYIDKVEAVGMGTFQDTISKVLSKKIVISGNSEVITYYYYDKYQNEICITKERTEEYKDGILEKYRITNYSPIGNGFWGQIITVAEKEESELSNGDVVLTYPEHVEGDSISNGVPAGQASLFTVKKLAGIKYNNDENNTKSKTPISSQNSIPIYEYDIVKALVSYKESFEGKTEKTISISIIEGDVIDPVDGVIKYNDEIYYLTSNNITKNSKGVRQNISAVRWY